MSKRKVSGFCGCLSDHPGAKDDNIEKAMRHSRNLLSALSAMPQQFASKKAWSQAEKSNLVHKPLKLMDRTCELGEAYAARAFDLLGSLTPVQAEEFKTMLNKISGDAQAREEFMRNMFRGYLPQNIHGDDPADTDSHFEHFEKILGLLLPDEISLPRVATMCRSNGKERYMPERYWPAIERRALDAFETAFANLGGMNVSYADSAHALPVEDGDSEDTGSDEIEL